MVSCVCGLPMGETGEAWVMAGNIILPWEMAISCNLAHRLRQGHFQFARARVLYYDPTIYRHWCRRKFRDYDRVFTSYFS